MEADTPCVNLTPNRYDAPDPVNIYVSNDFTIPVNPMTSQMNTIATQRTLLRMRVNVTKIILNSTGRSSNITISWCTRDRPCFFDSVYIKCNQMKL